LPVLVSGDLLPIRAQRQFKHAAGPPCRFVTLK
jgi:hypothetical protein